MNNKKIYPVFYNEKIYHIVGGLQRFTYAYCILTEDIIPLDLSKSKGIVNLLESKFDKIEDQATLFQNIMETYIHGNDHQRNKTIDVLKQLINE